MPYFDEHGRGQHRPDTQIKRAQRRRKRVAATAVSLVIVAVVVALTVIELRMRFADAEQTSVISPHVFPV